MPWAVILTVATLVLISAWLVARMVARIFEYWGLGSENQLVMLGLSTRKPDVEEGFSDWRRAF